MTSPTPAQKATLTKMKNDIVLAQKILPHIKDLKKLSTDLRVSELSPSIDDITLDKMRLSLNKAYDKFIADIKDLVKNPSLNNSKIMSMFDSDINFRSLSGIEKD